MKKLLACMLVMIIITTTLTSCDQGAIVDALNNLGTATEIGDTNEDNTDKPSSSDNTNIEDNETSSTEKSEADVSGYSEILQHVLTDEYYDSVLNQLKHHTIDYNSALLDPHPYAFFEDEGFDIEKIKNGNLKATTRSFVKPSEPNNLYMATYVETKAEQPFYTEYLIKYTLTDKEMTDYNMMHDSNYIQSVFMNDAVSEFKTPLVISESRSTIEVHENLTSQLRKISIVKNLMEDYPIYDILLKRVDAENDVFELYLLSGKDKTMKTKTKIAEIPLTSGSEIITLDDNNALSSCDIWGQFLAHPNFSSAQNEDVVIYSNQSYQLNQSHLLK